MPAHLPRARVKMANSGPRPGRSATGSLTEQPHGKLAVTVGSETEYFDPPARKDIDTQAVVDLRRTLGAIGYGLQAGHDGRTGG